MARFSLRYALGLAGLLLALGSCATKQFQPPAVAPSPPPAPTDAVAAGVSPGPSLGSLLGPDLANAYRAFRTTCPALLRRRDTSGLTQMGDWEAVCEEAAADPAPETLPAWFAARFAAVRIGDGHAFATGYYEPEIAGSRVPDPAFPIPIYARPSDLVETSRADGGISRGRLENGVLVPYYERGEIEDGALSGRGLEIAWAADAVDLFFLEIQGSGRLRLPDGHVMRIGYAGQNGRDYLAIGRIMKERGLLAPGATGLQDISGWLRAHPDEGRAIMRENKSYVFFRELTGEGPLGALGLPVAPRAGVAADPRFVPLGAPVWLRTDRPEAGGLWVAQDTGGAIKGPNRFDTFWGAGEEAKQIAGSLQARGEAYVLLPRVAAKRMIGDAPAQP